jgi:hypothetical protein
MRPTGCELGVASGRHGGAEDGGFAPSAPIRPTNPGYALGIDQGYALRIRITR